MARLPGSKDSIQRVRKKLAPEEKKVTVGFQIKKKHVETAKEKIQVIVDRINKK